MAENYPFNGTVLSNDIAVNDTYPKVQWGGTETGALYFEDVEVAGVMYQKVQNAAYNKWSNTWILVNPTLPAYAIAIQNGTMNLLTSPAGTTPFSAWQTQGTIVGGPRVLGVQSAVVADGSASITVTYQTPFLNATNEVFLSIGANYTGTDNAIIAARLNSVPSKSGFTCIVSGGQPGTKVDLYYVAYGS